MTTPTKPTTTDNQASELEQAKRSIDPIDSILLWFKYRVEEGYGRSGRLKAKAAIEALLREARVDELNKMHESYEVTLSADLDFDPTVYKARRIAQLRKQSKGDGNDQ